MLCDRNKPRTGGTCLGEGGREVNGVGQPIAMSGGMTVSFCYVLSSYRMSLNEGEVICGLLQNMLVYKNICV